MTETWLVTSIDKHVISDNTPNGDCVHQISKQVKTGGLAVIYELNFELKRSEHAQTIYRLTDWWMFLSALSEYN